MTEVTTHACRKCKAELPATTEFFYRAGPYFNWRCKPCAVAQVAAWKHERYDRPGFHERTCEHCDAVFVSAMQARHCTPQCNTAARLVEEKAMRLAAKAAILRMCVRCGGPIDPGKRIDSKFCSASCNDKAHAQTRKFRRRIGDGGRRRVDEPLISLVYFYERDGGRCGICCKPVNMTLDHPHPAAPSLDHILPLSLGGANEPANIQLAHLRCNLSKRDTSRGEQLRLIG